MKFISAQSRVVDAAFPEISQRVVANITEVLYNDETEQFSFHGRYEDEEGKTLRPLMNTATKEEIGAIQTATGVSENSFPNLWDALLTAGANYKLNADARFGETSWSVYTPTT